MQQVGEIARDALGAGTSNNADASARHKRVERARPRVAPSVRLLKSLEVLGYGAAWAAAPLPRLTLLPRMSAKKRSAECARRTAKTRATEEALPRTGQPPPPLPALFQADTETVMRHIDGYAIEWYRFIAQVADLRANEEIFNESIRRRVLRAEHELAPPDEAKPLDMADLIRYDEDYEPPGLDELDGELWEKLDNKCAGCDKMDVSWNEWDKRKYGLAEPRWRRRGTRQFVCWRCYERAEQGALTTLPYHK